MSAEEEKAMNERNGHEPSPNPAVLKDNEETTETTDDAVAAANKGVPKDDEQQSLTSGGDTETCDECSTAPSVTTESSSIITDGNGECQTNKHSVLRDTMTAGFAMLRRRRDNPHSTSWRTLRENQTPTSNTDGTTAAVDSCVSVNFIDPTTATSNSSPTRTPQRKSNFTLLSQTSSSESMSKDDDIPAVDLYRKLTSIFERDYRSTLHSIPYENVRNGARGTIEKLKIRSVLTRSHGVGKVANGDAMVPWGGTAATAAAPVSDPAEWHNGPYCHVYIAACESTEHYRNKVKPALQAFVSQIESAASSGSQTPSKSGTEDMSTSGNYSPHYVIVYVPTGPKAQGSGMTPPPSEGFAPANRVGAAFASRLSGVRRRLAETASVSSSRDISTDSIHSQSVHSHATNVSDGTESEFDSSDLAAAPPPGPVTHSSKLEKELYRRFTTDFPAGQTCIMTTLVDSVNDTSVATMSPLKNQEWNTFLHMLGSAIVSGFKDRCRRYDEELRRLDAHRATSPPPSSASTKGFWKDAGPRFNLSHFFLVKESLAFTYEQMRLPEEALLQYEELRAFVPEPLDDSGVLIESDDSDGVMKKKKRRARSKRSIGRTEMDDAMALATAGDSVGFRRRLRSTTDMAPLSPVVLQYLFARETNLLFKLRAPMEIIRRAHAFVKASYRMKRSRLSAIESKLNEERRRKERADIERWALNFCWDVKCACDAYFSESDMVEETQLPVRPWGGPEEDVVAADSGLTDDSPAVESSGVTDESIVLHTEKDLARTLSELLEFARIRLIDLGDVELENNPIRELQLTLPGDMEKAWPPLEKHTHQESDFPEEVEDLPANVELLEQRELLDGAFASVASYESSYLELTDAIVSCARFAGRRRFASNLDGERAEIFFRRGQVQEAAKTLLPIVDVCSLDRWERGHFWRLFRLACCQRTTNDATMYLSTLTHCFGQHLTPVAPRKALELLQRDLEVVVSYDDVADFPLGIAPFLETELSTAPTTSGKTTTPLHFMRKKVVNVFCLVGENATIDLVLTSHLCEPIEVQAIRIFVVAYDQYESLFHSKTTITAGDAFKILSLDAPVTVRPGTNKYTFDWIPMNTGHYILSTVQIKWKKSCFYYDSAALRRPLLGINILPSDPTQSLELNPSFLIPGHVQQVRITFISGSDNIREGSVHLLGFEGLQVIPPGVSPETGLWSRSCEVELSPCPPGEMVSLTTFVKSSFFTGGGEQGLQAKVATSYCHARYDALSEDEQELVPAMKTVLEASIFTLDRPPLSIDNVSVHANGKNRAIVSITLHCNVPLPFVVKSWDINLPNVLVNDGADFNHDLFDSSITEDEQVLFTFDCSIVRDAADSDMATEPTLDIVLEDEFGKLLKQSLALSLEEFYEGGLQNEMPREECVTAELSCSAEEGPMGLPVAFKYSIDLNNIQSAVVSWKRDDVNSKLLYAVSCNEMEWVLIGETQGIIEASKSATFSLDLVGIPVHAGPINCFPAIRLSRVRGSDASVFPVPLQFVRYPKEFRAVPPLNQVATACPSSDD